jgi:hypothetical protein
VERIQNCAPIMGFLFAFFTPNLTRHIRVAFFVLSIYAVVAGNKTHQSILSLIVVLIKHNIKLFTLSQNK